MKNIIVPRPVHDRIVVRRLESETITPGGLVIPEKGREKPCRGVVLAVGPGRWERGSRVPMSVVPHDVILFGKYAGSEVPWSRGGDVLVISDGDVLGVELEAHAHPRDANERVCPGGVDPDHMPSAAISPGARAS